MIFEFIIEKIFDLYVRSFLFVKFNIFYKESSELNYITPVEGTPFPTSTGSPPIDEQPLLSFFNFDRLNYNNDPQISGDGFFDFVPEITVIQQTGKIIFTKVEPFGEFLFESLRLDFSFWLQENIKVPKKVIRKYFLSFNISNI